MGNTLGSDEVASENFGKECYVEGIPPEHCIPRVHKISPSVFMEKYYKQGKPVILTGMMDDWPAVQVSPSNAIADLSRNGLRSISKNK